MIQREVRIETRWNMDRDAFTQEVWSVAKHPMFDAIDSRVEVGPVDPYTGEERIERYGVLIYRDTEELPIAPLDNRLVYPMCWKRKVLVVRAEYYETKIPECCAKYLGRFRDGLFEWRVFADRARPVQSLDSKSAAAPERASPAPASADPSPEPAPAFARADEEWSGWAL